MKPTYIRKLTAALCLAAGLWLSGCQASTTPAASSDTVTSAYRSMAPERVDIRGSIIQSRYDQGQVMLEVEGFSTTPDSRYTRAYVLVLPTTQMLDSKGQHISLSELRQGQNVAILLRGGGRGNAVGLGVARKLWLEEPF
ncbi:hypothetical protein [uncultured Pontibacter sp.]|uniref:hypothetical protein n=1 Tax=uncultured Pontibacter sp. TaxID=453356 RepID=UPI0026038151|nr:hypothetical protein [uncultured Pontibacter sp.]